MAKVEEAIVVEHEGLTWLGEWTEYIPYTGRDGRTAPHCYLVVSQVIDGAVIPVSDLSQSSYRKHMAATLLIAKNRAVEVRNRLFSTGDESVYEVMDVILDKVRNGEWLGQTTHNQEFTIYELAMLLDVTERKATELAKSLEQNNKATLLAGGTIMPCAKD